MKNNFTKFYIIRHGETNWNAKKIVQGQVDIPLNKTGEKQAEALAKELKYEKFDLAFSSDLLRAKRTTEIIALEHKLTVETTRALRERMFGEYEGKTTEKMSQTYSALVTKLNREERLRFKLTDKAESDEEMISRIFTFLRETAIVFPGKKILTGTHGGVIRILLVHLGYMSYEELSRKRILNGGFVILESDGTDFFIKEVNGIKDIENS